MKKTFFDILIGLLVVIAVTICEFLVTLPFGDPGEISRENLSRLINMELLLTSIPALLITFFFAWIFRTKTKKDAYIRSLIWTLVLAIWFILIGIGNATFTAIFSNIGIYFLLVCSIAGPIIFAKIKRLQ